MKPENEHDRPRRFADGRTIPSEPDYKAVFESLPGMYLLLDPELRIVAVGDAYARATMTKREEILGRSMFDVFPDNPEDPQATGVRNLRDSLRRVLRDRVPDTMPVQKYDIRRPEDTGGGFEERYWTPINAPVLGPDNRVVCIIHRVDDVTDFVIQRQKRLEQEKITDELRQKEERMETEIFARSREVAEANRKLREANNELGRLYEKTREVERLKTRFFANISHELRTPLTLILGPVDRWLKSGEIAAETRRGLETIQRNGHLLLRQVNNLLDIAKIEAERMHTRYAEVDLARLVRFVGFTFESLAEEQGIGYAIDVPRSAIVQMDPEKIQRILLNLLSNGIKFTPRGGSLALKLSMTDDRAEIEVRDSGPGVPAHLREQIFERFRQGEEALDRWTGGTGLGLAIVKEFVQLHHGSVTVGDAPGGGAVFRVILPRKAPAGIPVLSESASLYEELEGRVAGELNSLFSATAQEGKRGKDIPLDAPLVLVVDDNPDMNEFEAGILGRKYRVLTAADGVEGLAKALENRPDLIVSDIMMPRMSGDMMIRELRRRRELDDCPIIVITARTEEGFLVKMLQEGVQGYLVKPFSAEELMARVEGLVAEKKRKEELRQLVYAISHDLQEPLRTMGNFIGLLAQRYENSLDEEGRRYIAHVLKGAERMSRLIDDLLAFSRIGTHAKPFAPVAMNAVCSRAMEALQSAAAESHAEITRDDLPVVIGDEGQLVQLLQNLIGNAIKYRKREEPPRIHISAIRQGREWIFGVHDNGIGIEPRFHKQIFVIFQRLHTREEYPGTGIGLALCRKTLEQHHGQIWVESESGRGSTFYFSLPERREHDRTQ